VYPTATLQAHVVAATEKIPESIRLCVYEASDSTWPGHGISVPVPEADNVVSRNITALNHGMERCSEVDRTKNIRAI